MPNLTIVYIAGFPIIKTGGRSKATLEKVNALRKVIGGSSVRFFSPGCSRFRLLSYCYLLFFDLRMAVTALALPRRAVVIQRQTFLPVSNVVFYLRNIKIICEVHADSQEEIALLGKSRIEQLLLRILAAAEKRNFGFSSGIIYNNPLLQQAMDPFRQKASLCSYNGANPEDFKVLDQSVCRTKLSLDRNKPYFLFLGNVSRWHGVEMLIDVFLLAEMSPYVLLIVGGGNEEYLTSLMSRSGGRVNIVFIDRVAITDAVAYINAADVCLLPANPVRSSPGSPLKLYDYISCGKPVITQKDLMGYSDEVERYQLGMVTDFHDPVFAAKDLVRFLDNANPEFFRINNRNAALNHVSWDRRMEQWIAFCESVGNEAIS